MELKGSTFVIRPAGEAEALDILQVYRRCEDFLSLGPMPHASLDMVRADLEQSRDSSGVFCGIYDESGHMFGIVDYVPQLPDDTDKAYLALLMIAREYRSRGIGREVVEIVEGQMVASPAIREIKSGVQVNNQGAIRFWLSMGYEIESGPELLPDKTTVFHLRKMVR